MSTKTLSLSFRTDDKGGRPTSPKSDQLAQLGASRRLVLLLHGYNNDVRKATEAYDGFETIQRVFAGNADYAPGEQVVRVYWPGDADWGLASFFFFMQAITNAETSGKLLAQALENHARGEPLWVDIVAHSLGCRMAYEMLAALSPNSPVRVRRIVLFAAAVGTFMLEPKDQSQGFYQAYQARVNDGLLSLYSGSDMVLALAFPAGSTLAPGPQGFLPTALGHALWVSQNIPPSFSQTENHHAGHSDYWGWNKTAATKGKFAGRHARNFLRFVSAETHETEVRILPVRTGEEVREIARRQLTERKTCDYAIGMDSP